MLILLGLDKFFAFIPESCSLLIDIDYNIKITIGIVEIILGLCLFTRKFTRSILIFVVILMLLAVYSHIQSNTYDIGGALFLAIISLVAIFTTSKISSKAKI